MTIKVLLIFVLSFSCLGHALAGQGIRDFNNFKRIPVLDNGRLKPLDTFARSTLTQLSGHDHYEKENASMWLARLFFSPRSTLNDKIFLINNPEIAVALGINPQQDRRYTPLQLLKVYRLIFGLSQGAEKIDDKERSLTENEIIRVFDNINLYAALSSSFLFVFGQPALAITSPLAMVPVNHGQQWLSPLDALNSNANQGQTRQMAMSWAQMAQSYAKGDERTFNLAVLGYLKSIRQVLSKNELKKLDKFSLELFYQEKSPFTWSIMFYMLAFVFFVISFSSSKELWYKFGFISIIAGFIPHLVGLVIRIIIMARPPVSSLYETFIFVSLIAVFLGLLIECYNRQWLGIVTASICGTALLFIANKYSTEGDTLKVLIAVLNSNFWLATHVTTITMGYAATCVGGVLGHIWLVQALLVKDAQILDKTYKTTLGILGVALTLTFLGTNLGGIWADQSWGRFWGWDPKENGALMIVLWTALLFHAKVAQMIGPRGLAVGAVIGMMVVIWAWFGVNLLSVGLHSYGFTSGIATSLIVYGIVELIFILMTGWVYLKK